MPKCLSVIALALGLGATPSIGRAQAAVWSEDRVIARAAERAPDVQRAAASLRASQAIVAYSNVPIVGNPVIGVRTMFGVPDQSAATYSVLLGIPIDISGQRGYWRTEAGFAVQQAEASLQAAVNDARAAGRLALIDLASAEANVVIATEQVSTARELLERMTVRVQAQASTALDVALSERELGEAEADLAAARRDRELAAGRFRAALDLDPGEAVMVAALSQCSLPNGVGRDQVVARALARRREAVVFAASASRLRASTRRLRAGAISPLMFNGEFEAQGNSNTQWNFGTSFQWALPIMQLAQGERAVASGEAFAADTQRTTTERGIGREAAVAWNTLVQHIEEVTALSSRALPAAQRTLQLTDRLFESGSVDYFRVLQARRAFFSIRFRVLAAERDAWRARANLDRALGDS